MPITPFLRGEVFDSEVLDAMSLAFTQVCTTLGLVDRDPITQHVAGRMVELAQAGAVGPGLFSRVKRPSICPTVFELNYLISIA